MAPIKIKLSLSAASLQGQNQESSIDAKGTPGKSSSTPKKGNKAPQHARSGLPVQNGHTATPEAGPSRLKGASPLPSSSTPLSRTALDPGDSITAVPSIQTPSRSPQPTPKSSTTKSKGKSKAKPKTTKQAKKPTAIPTRLLTSAPSTPRPPIPLPLHETPSPGAFTEVKQEDVDVESGTPHTGSPSVEPDQLITPGGEAMDPEEIGTPTTAQKQSVRWMRIKRPLREHATKIVADLVKRDEVSLCVPKNTTSADRIV
jgi:bromodomain-containing protein 7/9